MSMIRAAFFRFIDAATMLLDLIDNRLQACMFCLMGLGLMLSSAFLYVDMISGSDWVTVCGFLFGSHAIGGPISQFAKRPTAGGTQSTSDTGNQRPV